MNGLPLMPPLLLRLHEDDHERYGAGPWRYDEEALTRLPYGELVKVERAIGMSLVALLLRMRQGYADANRSALWLARRQAGIVEPLDDSFTPLVTLMTAEVAGDDADPPDPGSTSSSSADPPPPSANGGKRGSPSTRTSRRATSRR